MREMNTTRESRMLKFVQPMRLDLYRQDEGMWYESREEKEETRLRYEFRQKRMAWVEAAMLLHLNPQQRECVRLHYLCELTFRQIGIALGVHHATAHRHCAAGIKILRELAAGSADVPSLIKKIQ